MSALRPLRIRVMRESISKLRTLRVANAGVCGTRDNNSRTFYVMNPIGIADRINEALDVCENL